MHTINRLAFTLAALALPLALTLGTQTTTAAESGDNLEEIIVTGSYIKGSPTDAELPIDVLTSDHLDQLGSPSILELVRNLGVTTANLAETNQFTTGGQANEGVATINLRGLGSGRTLVLYNGRRQVSTQENGVDINTIPLNAVGRVEVLKDGAAALYGSDAIGGVVNFITKEGFEGFELGGSYQNIEGSDGDFVVDLLWGTAGDNWSFMVAAEHAERGELPIRERDWALVTTAENTPGGWSGIGNPANHIWIYTVAADQMVEVNVEQADGTVVQRMLPTTAGTTNATVPDPQCGVLGALRSGAAGCGFQYAAFDNLIEETSADKIYVEFNVDLADNHRLHAEAMYSEVDLDWKTSPSYPPQSLTGDDRGIIATHPGYLDFREHYADYLSTAVPAGVAAHFVANRLDTSGLGEKESVTGLAMGVSAGDFIGADPVARFAINRAMGVVGRFGTGEPESAIRNTETLRFAVGMDGELFDDTLAYDVSLSWSQSERFVGGQDMYVERMALALRGYGGVGCDLPDVGINAMYDDMATSGPTSFQYTLDGTPTAVANIPGTGAGRSNCEWYNPFSRAIPRSYVNGAANPDYNPERTNSEALLRWLIGEERSWIRTNELTVFQAVVSGEADGELGGGPVSYALGLQVRDEYYDSKFGDNSNRALNPCPFVNPLSAALGLVDPSQLGRSCDTRTGQTAFLAASDNITEERTIYGMFGELAIPLSDSIDVQAALRYEDYGGDVGASLDPKVAVSWRPTDTLSFRGSVSTTFRGPPQSYLGGTITSLSFVPRVSTSAFKAVDTVGNPDLTPETALSTNFGAIYQSGNFYASVDWWGFTFEDSFQTEGFNQILNSYVANGCIIPGDTATMVPAEVNSSSACQALSGRIFPVAARTNLAATERIEVNRINGEEIKTSGIDFRASYDIDGWLPGVVRLELDGTFVLEYETDDQLDLSGGIVLAQGDDLVGRLNYNLGPSFTSKPEFKLNATISLDTDSHYASLITRYTGPYDDLGAPASHPHLSSIDSHITLDAHYQYTGWDSFAFGVAVVNIADEDPPAARGDINYDPFTHNPFGRMIKLDATYKLGQQ